MQELALVILLEIQIDTFSANSDATNECCQYLKSTNAKTGISYFINFKFYLCFILSHEKSKEKKQNSYILYNLGAA